METNQGNRDCLLHIQYPSTPSRPRIQFHLSFLYNLLSSVAKRHHCYVFSVSPSSSSPTLTMVRMRRQLALTRIPLVIPSCRATPAASQIFWPDGPRMIPIADSRFSLNSSLLPERHRLSAPPPALASAPAARPRLLLPVAPELPSADEPPPTRRRRSPMPARAAREPLVPAAAAAPC